MLKKKAKTETPKEEEVILTVKKTKDGLALCGCMAQNDLCYCVINLMSEIRKESWDKFLSIQTLGGTLAKVMGGCQNCVEHSKKDK